MNPINLKGYHTKRGNSKQLLKLLNLEQFDIFSDQYQTFSHATKYIKRLKINIEKLVSLVCS
jgi:hypothetical protein